MRIPSKMVMVAPFERLGGQLPSSSTGWTDTAMPVVGHSARPWLPTIGSLSRVVGGDSDCRACTRSLFAGEIRLHPLRPWRRSILLFAGPRQLPDRLLGRSVTKTSRARSSQCGRTGASSALRTSMSQCSYGGGRMG
jgi:hypothetical protein